MAAALYRRLPLTYTVATPDLPPPRHLLRRTADERDEGARGAASSLLDLAPATPSYLLPNCAVAALPTRLLRRCIRINWQKK